MQHHPHAFLVLKVTVGFTHTGEGRAEVEIPQPELSERLFLPSTVVSLKRPPVAGLPPVSTRNHRKEEDANALNGERGL